MLLNPVYSIDTTPPVADSDYTVTVAAGKVSADLTAFPLMIDLSDMPGGFWTNAQSDGGNIRVYDADGVTMLPHDLTYINKSRGLGRLFVKKTLLSASNNSVVVRLEESPLSKLAVTDTNGRNAVWSDYEVVWVYPELVNRTGNVFTEDQTKVRTSEWVRKAYFDMPGNPHQGIAVDTLGNAVTIDTNYLRRHTTSDFVTVLASNADPVGAIKTATGNANLNHLSDGCIIAGELWVPCNEYPISGAKDEYLVVFNLSDLTINRWYDISAVNRHIASICYNPDTSLIYAVDYTNGASLITFNTSGVHQGNITLSANYSALQGIEKVGDKLYMSREEVTNPIYEVEFDGTINGVIYSSRQTGINEGISFDGTFLYHMDGDGDLSVLERDAAMPDWGRLYYNGALARFPRSQVWSAGTSVFWTVTTGDLQQAFLSVGNFFDSTGGRATVAYDEGPDRTSIWNSNDGWLATTQNPGYNDSFRLFAAHNGTTERKLAHNGVANMIKDATVSARPAGSGTNTDFIINASTSADFETGEAYYQFAWIRHDYLSDDWAEADYDNMTSPGTFYSIT